MKKIKELNENNGTLAKATHMGKTLLQSPSIIGGVNRIKRLTYVLSRRNISCVEKCEQLCIKRWHHKWGVGIGNILQAYKYIELPSCFVFPFYI